VDLNEIAVFVRVVQAGSFNKAALLLNMPNSTVSAKISSLEERLGVSLLHRTTRKLNITQAGQNFYDKCLLGIEELKNAEEEVTLSQKEPQGTLTITAPAVLGASILPDTIFQYSKKFPKVRIELLLQDRRVDIIAEGVDLAIRAGTLQDSTLIAKKIGNTCFAPYATTSYLKSHESITHPKDLREHCCLQFAPLGKEKWQLVNQKGKQKVQVPMNGQIVADDLNFIKDLCLAGKGIALLPTFMCGPDVRKNKVMRVLPDWHTEMTPLHFVYPKQKFSNPKLQHFIETASEIFKERLQTSET
jgi:Transcriptional regulator